MSKVTLPDISLHEYTLDNLRLLGKLRQEHFQTKSEICVERAKYMTEYLRDKANHKESYALQRARAVEYFLAQKAPVFFDDNLLAGSTTTKPMGAPLYPEFFAQTIWPELDTISKRKKNPQSISEDDANLLNLNIFPYWIERSILEQAREEFGADVRLFEKFVYFIASKAGTISHTVPDYRVVVNKGINYLVNLAKAGEEKLAKKPSRTKEEQESLNFYQAVQISLHGMLTYAANLSKHAAELASKEKDVARKKLYTDMAEICRNVPANPAKTFREALNAIWIVQVCILAESSNMAMSPGRLDQILYPFYAKDIAEKRLTVAEAIELVGCFWLKLSDNVIMVPEVSEELFGGAGNVPAVTVGGVDETGADAVNDLTYIMLRATELLRTRDPNLNARYYPGVNSKDYRNRVSEVIANTKAVPAFYNDIEAIKTLMNQGLPLDHARDYAVVGCVELASCGRCYTASSSIILNLVTPFELALYNGRSFNNNTLVTKETGDPATFTSYNQFLQAYETQLKYVMENAINLNNKLGIAHQKYLPTPLLSAIFQGPLEKGKDLIEGGALYNSSGATHIGFADVVDSLSAIEELVYIEKEYTMKDLLAALRADFKGYDRLRQYLLNKAPKYGTDDQIALKNSNWLVHFLFNIYNHTKNYRGGNYWPSFWTMTNHAGFGRLSGALPNGRHAYQPFASGITPESGAAGVLTTALKSVGGLNPMFIPGGYALNLKFTSLANQTNPKERHEDLEKFGGYLEGYFASGGLHVQFNILSYEKLMDAKANPEKDPQLMVRVSGYSAYFNDLNDLMKDELISRTQYNLQTGKAVYYLKG